MKNHDEAWKWDHQHKFFQLYKAGKKAPLTILPGHDKSLDIPGLLAEGVQLEELVKAKKSLGSCSWSCGPGDWHPGGKCAEKGCFNHF